MFQQKHSKVTLKRKNMIMIMGDHIYLEAAVSLTMKKNQINNVNHLKREAPTLSILMNEITESKLTA
jgi:hypothetical protein